MFICHSEQQKPALMAGEHYSWKEILMQNRKDLHLLTSMLKMHRT